MAVRAFPFLKFQSNNNSNQLPELLNRSFWFDVFPSILISSKGIPIFKKEFKLKCSNYCPISLLPNIDKILYRIMYNRLYEFLKSESLIYDLQFDFRQKHSTSHALIHLTEKILEQLGIENFGCGIFADFKLPFIQLII